MRRRREATSSKIFDMAPFQECRQLGIANTQNSGLGCAQSPRPRSLRLDWGAALYRAPMNNNSYRTVSVIFPLPEDDWSVSRETIPPRSPAFLQPPLILLVYRTFPCHRKSVTALQLPWSKGTFAANPVPTSTALTFRTVTIQYWMTRERPFWNGYRPWNLRSGTKTCGHLG